MIYSDVSMVKYMDSLKKINQTNNQKTKLTHNRSIFSRGYSPLAVGPTMCFVSVRFSV